jgi:hypothetical protein
MGWSFSRSLSGKAMSLPSQLINAGGAGKLTQRSSTVINESGVGLATMLTTPGRAKTNDCGRLKSLEVSVRRVVLIGILAH